MVIVLDEYGQTSGLVAMEDILEEIVGNILDEYDEEDEMIQKQNDGSMIANGLTELEDLEDLGDDDHPHDAGVEGGVDGAGPPLLRHLGLLGLGLLLEWREGVLRLWRERRGGGRGIGGQL